MAFGRIDKRPNGRFRAQYIDPKEPRTEQGTRNYIRTEGFRKKSEARAWLNGVQADIARGTWRSPKQLEAERKQAQKAERTLNRTFGEYAKSWFSSRRLKESTRRSYELNLSNHILPQWSNTPLSEIDTSSIREWLAAVAPGREGARKKSYELFKTVLNSAVEDGLIPQNPCKRNMLRTTASAKKNVKPSRKHDPRALTSKELTQLADEVPDYMRLPVLLSGLLGLRMGEVRALRGRHVVRVSGTITLEIREAVTGDGSSVSFDTPKSRKSIRDLKVPSTLADEVLSLARQAGPDGLLFHPVNDPKRPIPDQSYRNNIANASVRCGIGHVSPHDLRHTASSLMQEHGTPEHVVAAILGHESTVITRRYTHSSRDQQASAVDVIDAVVMSDNSSVSSLDERRARA